MKTTTALFAVLALTFFSLPPVLAARVTFDWVTVGDPGNPADTEVMELDGTTGYGSVDYTYRISKYEVTAGQYTEFLNAVAASDPHGLYNTDMWSDDQGCKIARRGSDGSYRYGVFADRANRPVSNVSFFDAMRFVNWLENGQGNGDTETGVYAISDGLSEVRNPDATYFIPSEDEWYKAAYYDPSADVYYDYPTGTDSVPSNDLVDPDPGNSANFRIPWGSDYTIGSPYWRTEVGEFENSASPYGTFNQGGNVREWYETLFHGEFRGMRGGSYGGTEYSMRAFFRIEAYLTGETVSFGLRVASIPAPVSADFDEDGDVDGDDFLGWQVGFGMQSGAQKSGGDYDNDGDVDSNDLLGWQSEFGPGSGSASAAVPEPTSIASALLTVVVGMFSRRRGISRPSR